jgi:uncharacterized small protein (DUF1192 family)
MHGGTTPRGTASPHYKHGLYSRYAHTELAQRIADLRQEEERLHDLREVLAVQGALLGEALQREELAAAAALTEAISRSISRYHKDPPPQRGNYADMTVEEIESRINQLLATAQQREGSAISLPVRFPGTGNPKQGAGTGNP